VLRAGRSPNPALIEAIRKSLGLNRPVYVQYWDYIKNIVLHFNFGYSYQFSQPVRTMIFQRLPATISLTVGAVFIWLLIGLPIGIISAVRSRSVLDRSAMGGALLAISAPSYWLGLVALYLFANDIGVFKIFDGANSYTGLTADPGRWFGSLIMPWFVLAASFAAFYSRLLRSNLIETMSEDYIRTARAKGLSERRVVYRHGLRSALTPVVTQFGIDLGTLLGGAIVVENVFGLPGLGALAVTSVTNEDLPVIIALVMLASAFIVLANIVVDIVYVLLDPRVRAH
jgi:peptide/nickel transport system permease protein